MIDPQHLQTVAIAPAFRLLGPQYASAPASALLIAIALQESGLRHRVQIDGPAHGLWQFELIGCEGVLEHPASLAPAKRVCQSIIIEPSPEAVYQAVVYNDVLAAAFARLALWRLPDPLPIQADGPEAAWGQYIECWRPGKPHRERWNENWAIAWSLFDGYR